MSRLQKKKPLKERKKKKRTVSSKKSTDVKDKPTKFSAVLTGLQASQEKSLTDSISGKQNFFQKSVEFFREVKIEVKKVTWPTRKQTTGTTIVVVIFVFVISAFLGIFDYSLSKLVQVVLT